jgi:cation:H+ antiporter
VTTTDEDVHENVHPGRQRLTLLVAFLVTLPGVITKLADLHPSPGLGAVLFGLAIVGAAFILSWAAEVAQLFISAGLAIAVLAFIAVLPEYAVDMVFSFKGGRDYRASGFDPSCRPAGLAEGIESNCSLALANMTGANRLLIGVGWSMVVFIAWWRLRKRASAKEVAPKRVPTPSGSKLEATAGGIALERSHAVEVSFLLVATLYSLTLPFKTSITLVDAAVLVGIFVVYTIRISRAPAEEPHLVGPARWIGSFSTRSARLWTCIGLFVVAAGVILLCAEPFAHNLVETGEAFGISEFLLVQWLAPLASESPELLVAGLYAWRLNTNAGLGTLVSSKVNQWTLLVGTLPIVFAIASSSSHGLPISTLQRDELLLTAAQSLFAVAILNNLTLSNKEALSLFGLFWAQFILGGFLPEWERRAVAGVYLLLAVIILVKDWGSVRKLLRDGFRTPYSQLAQAGD